MVTTSDIAKVFGHNQTKVHNEIERYAELFNLGKDVSKRRNRASKSKVCSQMALCRIWRKTNERDIFQVARKKKLYIF
jgi:phage regulator Rha-like protein